ncbi:MAG: hypothetical protein QOI41_3651, partial [Myxococcales bacterium]|nr:hypothetical protein [Myxococcales bacterium]
MKGAVLADPVVIELESAEGAIAVAMRL